MSDEHEEENSFFSIKQEDFKGLNPDFYVDLAVKQCIWLTKEEPARYYWAVQTLEGALVSRLDDQYFKEFNEIKEREKTRIPKNEIDVMLAPIKFRLLMSLIHRHKAPEELYEL